MAAIWKTVKIFISSTFRDMHAERDQLVKVVFPELREKLEKHRIHLVDIDLRWGITEEQSDSDRVLELCLNQIDECRPYFLGILGERYGWVPGILPDAALSSYGWIQYHTGKSVTELEILHGVLNDPAMQNRAFFYFRDRAFMSGLSEDQRGIFDESPTREELEKLAGDQAEASAAERREKLRRLKDKIRMSGLPVMESYPCRWDPEAYDPPTRSHGRLAGLEAFGMDIRDRLWEAIRIEHSLDNEADLRLDPLKEELDYHERFIDLRLRVYVGRDEIHRRLLDYADGNSNHPLIVTGQSGSGKSAILARLCRTISDPGALTVPHFVGASPGSTSIRQSLRRFCLILREAFGFSSEIPQDMTSLTMTFRTFLTLIPEDRRLILVIDAINQFDENDQAHELLWLPEELSGNVKILLSCLDDPGRTQPALVAARRMALPEHRVEPLAERDCMEIIDRVPSISAKTLDRSQKEMLLRNPATGNPLYLLIALEELRGFGSYENLVHRIAAFPREGISSDALQKAGFSDNVMQSAGGDEVTAIFMQVIERLEQDFDRGVVRKMLSLLAASRHGLSERELRDLLPGQADDLFPVLRQLRSYLMPRGEMLDFFHRSLWKAIQGVYHRDPDAERSTHIQLADYFESHESGPRKIEELPWQLSRAGSWKRLYDLLSDLDFFKTVWDSREFEAKGYWAQLEENYLIGVLDAYRPVLEDPERHRSFVSDVSSFLYDTGHLQESLLLREYLVRHYRKAADHEALRRALGKLASILKDSGDLDKAMAVYKEVEHMCREEGDNEDLQYTLGNQGLILKDRGDLDGAMTLLKEAESICRELGDKSGLEVSLDRQALIFHNRDDLDGAMALLKEAESICRELGDMAALRCSLGLQAIFLKGRGDYNAAMALQRESERISRALGDKDGLRLSIGLKASILKECGDLDGAIALYKETERICRELGDKAGLGNSLGEQACILHHRGDLDEARALYVEQEIILRELGDKAGLQASLGDWAELLADCGDLDGATELYIEQERISRALGDKKSLQAYLGRQADILRDRGDYNGAMKLYKEAEGICRELGDKACLGRFLNSQAVILCNRRDFSGAMERYGEAEGLCRESDYKEGLRVSLENQAIILCENHDLDGAMAKYKEGECILRELGDYQGLVEFILRRAVRSTFRLRKPKDALLRIEEAYRLVIAHNMSSYKGDAGKVKPLLALILAVKSIPISISSFAIIFLIPAIMIWWRPYGGLDTLTKMCMNGWTLGSSIAVVVLLNIGIYLYHLRLFDRRLRNSGELDEAMALHRERERIAREAGDKAGLGISLGNQANILYLRSDFDGVMELYMERERTFRELGNHEELAGSILKRAQILAFKLARPRDALPLADEAYCLTVAHNLKSLENKIVLFLMSVLAIRSIPVSVLLFIVTFPIFLILAFTTWSAGVSDIVSKLLEIGWALGSSIGIVPALNYGVYLLYMRKLNRRLRKSGALDGAMKLHREKESVLREMGYRKSLRISLENQADISRDRGDFDGAIARLEEVERISRELGDRAGLAASIIKQANILYDRRYLDEAMELYQEAENISRELGDKAGLQASLGGQANILYRRRDFDAALRLYKEQESLLKELGDPEGLVGAVFNQVKILAFNLYKPKDALSLAKEAYRLAASHNLGYFSEKIKSVLASMPVHIFSFIITLFIYLIFLMVILLVEWKGDLSTTLKSIGWGGLVLLIVSFLTSWYMVYIIKKTGAFKNRGR
ncbi:MAG: DUF4062 domain-containing protein [Candidatus Xenobiia bacterium LiM19]